MPLATATRPAAPTFAAVCTDDQWLRCAHWHTAVDLPDDLVSLYWTLPESPPWQGTDLPDPAGLAFDPQGCLYHGDLESGQVQRVTWRPTDPLSGHRDERPPVDLLAPEPLPSLGDFSPAGGPPGPTLVPSSLAIDLDEHLFLLDHATGRILVFDLSDGRLLRTITLPAMPVDLAADGRSILAATADRSQPLYRFDARQEPTAVDVAPESLTGVDAAAVPVRVTVGTGGEIWLLLRAPDGRGWAVPVNDPRASDPLGPLPSPTDLELDGRGDLIVAGPPGGDLRRFTLTSGVDAEQRPLQARRYDGRGIVRTPGGPIGFWTAHGFRVTVEGRVRYDTEGRVDLIRLDSGTYRGQWGRIFVDACIPAETSVKVAFVTADDEPGETENDGASIARTAPANLVGSAPLPRAWPPLVAASRLPELGALHPLHRREIGGERPWASRQGDDRIETYEAPVSAPPGRYLWVRLVLRGTRSASPRVRAVRVEHPGHDWLSRLPRVYSGDEDAASFLRRYLALPAGVLSEMEQRSSERDLLFDPFGAPAELLPWLASLVGLTLDERWPEPARRQILAQAVCLFRRRGTVPGLRRILNIYLGCEVILVEKFRLRGLGGGVLGDQGETASSSVVGFGFRVGGGVGTEESGPPIGSDPFTTHAHRFTVIVPRDLDDEEEQAARHLLELHRPAHTLIDLCTVGAGMRVGTGLHVELSSIVGPSSGFRRAVVGAVRVGGGAIIGRPGEGIRPGGSKVGVDSRVDL